MKTINSFRSKLLALTLVLMASVSSFAYDFTFGNDFHIDGFAYKIISRTNPCSVALIEVADCEKHVALPESVTYNDSTFIVTTLGMGNIVFSGTARNTMESIYIPKTIMIVNYRALGDCPNLKSIVVDEENKYLDSRNNCNAIISSNDTYRPANQLVVGCKTTVIPNSVTEIGNYAFVRCETLENITIPEGVTRICDGAFYECTSLSSIKLPESITQLPQQSIFSGCTNLKEVFFFAKTPPYIAYGMFQGLNPTIYVPTESQKAYIDKLYWQDFDIQAIPDSMYFDANHFVKDSIHYHILNDTIAPFEVEVTYTFGSLSNMTQKNYPELTEVNIPAFVEYKGHTYIVTRIGELAFNCAQKLQRVTMGENIKTIDRFAIMNCPQLKEVQIGESVDSILLDAFSFGKLQQLTIPKNVKYIAPLIVRNNPITSIKVDPENTNYTSINGVLFNKKKNILHTFPAAYATRYTIPESVDTIGSCAFAGTSIESVIFPKNLVCISNDAFTGTNLTELILPASLQSIGMYAFDMCSNLKEVICHATTPPIMSDGESEYKYHVFMRVPVSDIPLYVPAESVEAYKSANQWKEFGQIQPLPQTPEDLFPTLWGLQRTSCDEWFDGCEENKSYLFSPKEITEINGKQYLKCGGVFLREEDSKVLIYSFPYEKDLVLYDYTLEVGDTLQNLGIDIYSFPELEYAAVVDYIAYEDYDVETDEFIIKKVPLGSKRVTEVSTITLLDGKEYKRWLFGNDWENGNYYVEGIGNVGGSFGGDYINIANPYALPACYMGERLVCVSKNNKLLYQMDDAEMERLGAECLCDVETSYKSQWCDTWNVMWFDGMFFDETASTSQYRLGKDTIIGDYTYSKFTSRTSVRFTNDKKVYVYYEGFDDNDPYSEDLPTGEYLAYDFSAKVGDTLEVFSGIGTYSTYPCVVDDVQADLKTFPLIIKLHPLCDVDGEGNMEISSEEITWIEGVGSPNGFLISDLPGRAGGGLFTLLCAYKDDELKYTGSFYERFGCDYNAGVISDDLFPTLSGLQRTICREYYEQADNKTRMEQFTNLTTRTETGAPYIYCSPFLLREKDNKILIYSRTLNKDLVLYDFNLQVGDSLPMLYIDFFAKDDWIADRDMEIWCIVDYHKDLEGNILPADTLIVTDVSMITLLDGKEYKKWTFNNGMEYVEGIGSFGNGQWSGDFFQLIANKDVPTCLLDEHLVCASKNGQLLYQMDDAEMEQLETECLCEIEPKWSETWCNQWNILSHGYQGPQEPLVAARTSIFWLSNNTVKRDGQEYIPLMCSSSKPDVESTNLIGELRFTEDKQVYFYYDNTEYLLYDFDVQVGDTLDIFGGIELYSYSFVEQKTYPHVITKIDTLDDGRLQITSDAIVIFEDGEVGTFEEKQQQIWIEGLGSINGIVHTGINPGIAGNPAIVMLCAYRDDECVYKTDSNDPYWIDYTQLGCVYNAGDFIEGAFPMLSGLQRTVCNEYCGETEDDNSANNTYKQTFDSIFFENDKPYILCNDYLLREEDNKILIYSQLLNKDLVLYDFTLEVGDSLPALYIDYQQHNAMDWMPYNPGVVDYNIDHGGTIYPADTFIVTNISTVTLLDGKEYKKWTFNNGMEYVEGIGMYGGHRNGDFFRLIQEIIVPCNPGTHLVCVSKNNKLLYQMDAAEMERLGAECLCDYDRGPRKDNAKDGQIGGRPTPTQWNQLELDLREMDNGTTILRAETFSYTLENDSVVANDKIFYQLARQSTKDTATTKSFVGALHFGKDEDNRVYFLRDGVEYVLYDFTAEPGDTVEIFAGINNYPQDSTYTHVVVDKDTTEDGACRMFLEVVFPEETTNATNAEKVWLAGLGSVDGIVHNAAKRTSNAHAAPARSANSETQTSVMLCAWREDSCLYITDHPDYNDIGCIYNQDPTSIEDTHSPSPIADYQKLLRDGQLLIIHTGKTYNVLGVQVK